MIDVDTDKLEAHINDLGRIGSSPDLGLYRGLYTAPWAQAMDLVATWMEEAGLSVSSDAVGNVFGRLPGMDEHSAILTGSHIDTVPDGGKFDGAAGIHAGIFALSGLLSSYGRPRRSLEVVALCEEEGSRFNSNLWGTRAILGIVDREEAYNIRDEQGTTIAEAMRGLSLDPEAIHEAARGDVQSFIELHIEQGPRLEHSGSKVGIVNAITGLRQLRVELQGTQGHAGTSPMDLRRDPVAGAAEIVLRIEQGIKAMGRPAVVTCGQFIVKPGGINVVADRVVFTIDSRNPDAAALGRQNALIEKVLDSVAAERRLKMGILMDLQDEPVEMDAGVQRALAAAAADLGVQYESISSGAGHDSMLFAQHVPTGMVFVPSRDGVSHSSLECTTTEDLAIGTRVLAGGLFELAYR